MKPSDSLKNQIHIKKSVTNKKIAEGFSNNRAATLLRHTRPADVHRLTAFKDFRPID